MLINAILKGMFIANKNENSLPQKIKILRKTYFKKIEQEVWSCAVLYMHPILDQGSFCMNYFIIAVCDRGDQPVII